MKPRVLLVDAHSERTLELVDALGLAGFEVVAVVPESGDVHGQIRALKPDAILIDSASPTRDTIEGFAVIGKRYPRPILMLSEGVDTDLVREAARLSISVYAVEGFSPGLLRSLIEATQAHFQSRRDLAEELMEAKQALTDRRVVERAKYRLVEELGLSESEAYHRLRRQAMSRGLRMAELAQEVLEQRPSSEERK
jgi:response regulator NasT